MEFFRALAIIALVSYVFQVLTLLYASTSNMIKLKLCMFKPWFLGMGKP